MRLILRVSLVLLVAISAFGQSTPGAPFPLTNTRYGESGGHPRLVTDGKDFYLFWLTESNIRMTRLVDGEARAGRAVMPVEGDFGHFDVVFTGRYFLVATTTPSLTIVARLVSTDGEPAGDVFTLVTAWSRSPRLAFNGRDVLVAHQHLGYLAFTRATAEGQSLGPPQAILPHGFPASYDVASNGDGFALLTAAKGGDRLVIFDATGAIRSEQSLGGQSRSLRIASDGRGYRAAGVADDNRTWSCTFEPNGTLGTTVTLGDAYDVSSLIWTGTAYKAALRQSYTQQVRIADLDRSTEIFSETEPISFSGNFLHLAALNGRVLAAWYSYDPRSTVNVSPLPLTSDSGTPAAFGAAEQTLLATATSRDATLVVWSEPGSHGRANVHLGLRGRDGSWAEGTRSDVGTPVVAASDGHDFLLVYSLNEGRFARRFDSAGRPVTPPVAINARFTPESMLWNGQNYVVAGVMHDGNLAVLQVSTNGIASEPVVIQRYSSWTYPETPVIATDGTAYLVAWVEAVFHPFPPFGYSYQMWTARVSADLVPGKAFLIEQFVEQGRPGLAWDGTNYVAAWPDYEFVRARRISTDGIPLGTVASRFWSGVPRAPVHAMTSSRGVTLSWRSDTFNYYTTELNRGNGDGFGGTILLRSYAGEAPHAMPLPDGRAAILAPVPLDEPPFHGSRRITMTVLDHVWPRKPLTAPAVTVRLVDGRFRIEWTAVHEDVTGYRVEYRIGDGNWNELERAPDPSSRSATFRPVRSSTAYAFRVRAMSDGGMGPYSDAAVISNAKRRSVR